MKTFRFEDKKRSAIITASSLEEAVKLNQIHKEANLPFIGEEKGFFAQEGKEAIKQTGCSSYISFFDKKENIGWAECI